MKAKLSHNFGGRWWRSRGDWIHRLDVTTPVRHCRRDGHGRLVFSVHLALGVQVVEQPSDHQPEVDSCDDVHDCDSVKKAPIFHRIYTKQSQCERKERE